MCSQDEREEWFTLIILLIIIIMVIFKTSFFCYSTHTNGSMERRPSPETIILGKIIPLKEHERQILLKEISQVKNYNINLYYI